MRAIVIVLDRSAAPPHDPPPRSPAESGDAGFFV